MIKINPSGKFRLNPSIFKAYDIRGLYPQEINEEAVYKIGLAFGLWLNRKSKKKPLKIILNSDVRISSPKLKKSVLRKSKKTLPASAKAKI